MNKLGWVCWEERVRMDFVSVRKYISDINVEEEETLLDEG